MSTHTRAHERGVKPEVYQDRAFGESRLPSQAEISPLFEPVQERARFQHRLGISPDIARARLLAEYQHLLTLGEEAPGLELIRRSSGPHLAYLRRSPWLSDVLGRPVLQVRHLLGVEVEGRLEVLGRAVDDLRRLAPQDDLRRMAPQDTPQDGPKTLLILRAPVSSIQLIQGLTERGFSWVGVELTGVIKLDALPEPLPELGVDFELKALGAAQLTQAQEIAALAHSHNHFEYDPLLDTNDARRLFQEQVALHFMSERSRPFGVSRRATAHSPEELFGFIVANKVHSFEPFGGPLLANLDFISVHPERQLKGVGHALNVLALRWLYQEGVRRVSVRTMVNNFAAQAILSRVGWRAQLAEAVFHLHL